MPYVFLDATYIKTRNQHRIVGRAVVVATAVTIDGNREVLGIDVGDSEDEVFWTAFLRHLRDRGLSGVRLVISDAHSGLKAAISRVFAGASWQRCKVHLARNTLATVNHAHKDMVAAMARTIHAQPDAPATRAQLHAVVNMLTDRFPKAAEILAAAESDVTAYATFPRAHWRKISSTNPLERINKVSVYRPLTVCSRVIRAGWLAGDQTVFVGCRGGWQCESSVSKRAIESSMDPPETSSWRTPICPTWRFERSLR